MSAERGRGRARRPRSGLELAPRLVAAARDRERVGAAVDRDGAPPGVGEREALLGGREGLDRLVGRRGGPAPRPCCSGPKDRADRPRWPARRARAPPAGRRRSARPRPASRGLRIGVDELTVTFCGGRGTAGAGAFAFVAGCRGAGAVTGCGETGDGCAMCRPRGMDARCLRGRSTPGDVAIGSLATGVAGVFAVPAPLRCRRRGRDRRRRRRGSGERERRLRLRWRLRCARGFVRWRRSRRRRPRDPPPTQARNPISRGS